MISMIIYSTEEKENLLLKEEIRKLAGRLTDEYWSIYTFRDQKTADDFLDDMPLLDFGCCSLSKEMQIRWLETLRAKYVTLKIMLIADITISPMRYLRPQIMATSLLLKPYTKGQLQQVLTEFLESSLESGEDPEASFVVETREGRTVIPYEQIYYIEAKEKKVYIRLLKEEYGFYDTIENLEKQLPEYFFRSHRSFIVNGRRIRRVRLSASLIELSGGFEIPLSRSYKNIVKERMKNGYADEKSLLPE